LYRQFDQSGKRRAGAGLRERGPRLLLPEKSRRENFTRCTNSDIPHTPSHILTLKGGEVLMATKKAAAKKPVKKAAKKK
jgi:hypothetical protein